MKEMECIGLFDKYELMYEAGISLQKIYLTATLDFTLMALVLFGTLFVIAYFYIKIHSPLVHRSEEKGNAEPDLAEKR